MPPSRSTAAPHRAVVFDMDGTLVDSAPSMTRALNEMAQRRGIDGVGVAAVRRWVSLGGEVMLRGVLGETVELPADLNELRGILRAQTADPADLYPGAVSTLAKLRDNGYRVGICTNKREDIAVPYAAGLGIAEYLDAIVGGADNRSLKPDPELAHLTLARLGARACEAVFVGDSEIDADTAAAAAIPFVLVTFGYPHGDLGAIRADARVDHLREVPSAVSELSSS